MTQGICVICMHVVSSLGFCFAVKVGRLDANFLYPSYIQLLAYLTNENIMVKCYLLYLHNTFKYAHIF